MATYTGLFNKIKDKNYLLADRLQLIQFAWCSGDVSLPNKQSVIIDVIVGLLVNRKKFQLEEGDILCVWRCLHNILQSGQCADPAILVKPSLGQVVAEAVQKSVSGPREGELWTYVINSCHRVLTCPHLAYVLTSKYLTLANLLGSVSELCRCTVDTTLYSILAHVITAYITLQGAQHNQKQVLNTTVGRLLMPLVRFVESEQELKEDQGRLRDSVRHIIFSALFHSSHREMYRRYLSAAKGDKSGNEGCRPLEEMFQILENLTCKDSYDDKEAVTRFIPKFLAAFMKAHDKSLCHKMVARLCKLIGCESDSAPSEGLATSQRLRAVNSILKEIHAADIYNVAKDAESGGHQLKFYRNLAHVTLSLPVEAAWYGAVVNFLHLHHGILEPQMTQILTNGWLCFAQEDTSALVNFLTELFSTYSKLRQVPKLLGFIMSAVETCQSGIECLVCPKLFTQRLHDIVQSLPQSTTVEIWERLVEELKGKYISQLDKSSVEMRKKCSCLLTLLRLYLGGVKMADYSVTEVTARRVQQLMEEMESKVFQPLYNFSVKQDEDLMISTLYLSYVWGELKLMLALYDKKYRAVTQFNTATVSHLNDLTLVHPYLTSEKWSKMFKKGKKSNHKGLHYLMDLLSVQKVKALLLFSPNSENLSHVTSIVESVLQLPDDVSNCRNASWDGQVSSLKGDNSAVSSWKLTVDSLPILSPFLLDDHFTSISQFVVKSMSSSPPDSRYFSISSLSAELLRSPVAMETRKFHSAIISSLCQLILPTNQKSPKKKKKQQPKVAMVMECLQLLVETENLDAKTFSKDYLESMTGVTSLVEKLLQAPDDSDSIVLSEEQLDRLKIFGYLPLEFLTPGERVRSFLALCCLASVSSNKSDILNLLALLLDGLGQTSVFQVVRPQIFFDWLTGLSEMQDDGKGDSGNNVNILLDRGCQSVVKDYHVVAKIQDFINQLSKTLTACSDQLQQQRKIHRASSTERSKFMLASLLLKHLALQLQKQSLPQVIREHYSSHFNKLSTAIVCVLTTLRTLQDKKRVVSPSSHLIGCFTSVLNQSCIDVEKHVKKRNKGAECEEKSDPLDLESEIVDNAEFMMQSIIDDIKTGNISSSGPQGLEFVQVICKHHKHFPKILSPEALKQLWTLLLSVVTRSHDQHKLKMSSESVNCESGADVLYRKVKKMLDLKTCSTNEECNDLSNEEGMVMENDSEDDSILPAVYQTLGTVLMSVDLELFREILETLASSISPTMLAYEEKRMTVAMTVWGKLLAGQITEAKRGELKVAAQHIMMNLQTCLEYLHGMESKFVLRQAIPILRTQTAMLTCGHSLLPRQTAVLCLHGCQVVPLEGSTYSSFIPACIAVQEVLTSLMTHHPNAALSAIPSVMANIKHLLVSVIQHGCQDRLLAEPQFCDSMVNCANLVTRLLSLLEAHKVEFSKVVVYLLSDYAYQVQMVTLLPAVKKALLPGIYILLDIADRFQISQLLMSLPHGTKEVFKLMYTDYTKYHKYSGRV